MIKLSRSNQTSLFPDYKGVLTKHIIPTLIGDIFETVTRILFKSHIVGAGIGSERADLIANRALIEVKSGYYPCGKVVFTERQWEYYSNYHSKYHSDGIDIIYMFYGYHRDKKRPFYQFKDEDEIIKHVLGGVKKLYLLDHESVDAIRDQVAYHFKWPYKSYVAGCTETNHTPGFYIAFRRLEDILSEYKSVVYNVPEMDIMGYTLCSFGCHSFNLVGHNCDGITKLQRILSGIGEGHVESIPPEYKEKEEPPLPF